MTALRRLEELARRASSVRRRDVPEYWRQLDEARSAAISEGRGDPGAIWELAIRADEALPVPRQRPPLNALDTLPPRVLDAMATAFYRKLQQKTTEAEEE